MKNNSQEFIAFAIQSQALLFGEFKVKSGRMSPYFFNAGRFNTGHTIAKLGQFYAQAIVDSGIQFDMLFGPAYKGIPLVTAVAIALAEHHNIDKPYAFNRKEAKDHGEGGSIVGSALKGKVLVIDDVMTAGTTINETAEILKQVQCEMTGLVISFDRQERTPTSELSAVEEVKQRYNMPIIHISQLADLIAYLEKDKKYVEDVERIKEYRKAYGCRMD